MVARLRLNLLGGIAALFAAFPAAFAQSEDDLFAQVFGSAAQAPVSIELDLDLTVQGVVIGAVSGTINGDEIVDLERASLLDSLQTFIAGDRLAPLRAEDVRVTAAELTAAGIDLAYDPVALAVEVTVPPEFRIEWQVPIAPLRPPAAGRTRYEAANVSGAINLQPSLGHDSETDRVDAVVLADGFFNVRGWAVQGEARWSERTDTFRRGPVRLHRDFVERRLRLTVGELRSPQFGLQPALPLRGISIGRVFSIDPYQPPFPGLVTPLLLEAPTEVEVTIDGRLVERIRLPAGPTVLSDFPFRTGLNDVRLDLYRDGVFQQQLDYQGWFDRIRLDAGVQEFHVSLGQPWLLGTDRPRVDQDEPWLSAAIRRGINVRWTSGLGLVADTDTGDAVIDWINDIGLERWSLRSDLAVSRDSRPGTAGAIAMQQEPMRGRIWSLRMALGWRDGRFRPFGIETPPGREMRGEFSASRALGDRWRWIGSVRMRDTSEGRVGRLSSVLAWRPDPEWSIQLRAVAQAGTGPDDLGITVALDWRPRRGDHSFSGEFNDEGDWLAGWRYNTQLARSGQSANLVMQETDGEQVLSGGVSMRTHRFRAGLGHRRAIGNEARTRLAAQTALVFADGHFGISDRVGEGFVLFAGRPGTGRVDINPDGDDWRSRSDVLGPAVIGDLTPYLERGFTIGLPEVPIRSDPGDLQPVALGGFLQGVRIPVGPVPGVTLQLTLAGPDGAPLALMVGELIPEDGSASKTFFSNRAGRVELGSVVPGSYRLRVEAAGLDIPIEVAESPTLQELGTFSP